LALSFKVSSSTRKKSYLARTLIGCPMKIDDGSLKRLSAELSSIIETIIYQWNYHLSSIQLSSNQVILLKIIS